MKVPELRAKMRELKGDLLRLELDERTGKVAHCEIHQDSRLIWKWPPKSRARLKPVKWQQHGAEWKAFTLEHKNDGYEYEHLAKMMEA